MTSQQTPAPWEDTIDLRRWIDALVRRWWLIVAITVLAIAAAVVIGYGIQSPTYESSGGATLPSGSSHNGIGLTPGGYQEFASSTPVMDSIRERLGIEQSAGRLRNQYTFTVDDNGFITVTATAESGEQAFRLASAWIEAYDQQVQKLVQQEFARLKDELAQEAGLLSQDLDAAKEDLTDFDLENPPSAVESQLQLLESELSESKRRLRELSSRSLPEMEMKLASLEESLGDNTGAVGGGGTSTGTPGTASSGLGALVPDDDIAANSVRVELSRKLMMAQVSNLEDSLLESESRLRELTLSSIPLAQARVASLEKALPDELEARPAYTSAVTPDSTDVPDPLYLQLVQGLAETRVELEVQQREAETLDNKIAILRRQLEEVRAELVSLQVAAEDLQGRAAARQQIKQAASELTARRQEARTLEAIIPGLEEQVRQLRRENATLKATRQELQAEVDRLSEEYGSVKGELDTLLDMEPDLSSISSLSTIREPALPADPVSPPRVRNTILAAFLGLMGGASLALFWDYYRTPPPAASRQSPE